MKQLLCDRCLQVIKEGDQYKKITVSFIVNKDLCMICYGLLEVFLKPEEVK